MQSQSFAPFNPHLPGVKSAAMRALILLSTSVVSLCIGQTNFGAAEKNANPSSDVNTRIFTGPDIPASPLFLSNTIILLGSPTLKHVAGNQALDSGLVGIGLGALGATVLAPAGQIFLPYNIFLIEQLGMR